MVTAINSSSATRIYVLYRSFYVYPSPLVPIRLHHPGQNSGLDTWPPIRFHPGKARAETLIPPRENSGPDVWASFRPGGLSGPVIRALVPPGRKLGPRCSGPNKFPGYRSLVSPPELMTLRSNLPLSLSSAWVHHVTAASSCVPLSARSHLDSQLLSFVERVLMGISSVPRS